MAWTEWAYDTAQTNPAQLVSTDWREIDAFVPGDRSSGTYRDGASSDLNDLSVYPATRTGAPPDQWFERDEPSDTFAYIVDPVDAQGLLYEITEAWSELSYLDAKKQARDILEQYLFDYTHSQFTAAGFTFSASFNEVVDYLVMDRISNNNPEPLGQVVQDILGDAHQFDTLAEWQSFWEKYENLFDTGRGIADAAWTDIKNSTTTDEVRIIIAALPPIPGT